jgi:predicted Zn-dependent protease with MMP-like domain
VGAPLTDGEPVPGELPPTIFLFQRNLERYAEDEVRLIEEIRTTLYHELGHALGFDEDGVEDMGLA